MLKNYFKTSFRSLQKNKTFSFINIIGLAIGTLCCLYIMLYVQDQYSYDKQHDRANDIYRINTLWTVQNDKGNWATVTAPVAPAMKKDFPEVEQFARIIPGVGMSHHLLRYKEKAIYENDMVYADSTLFNIFNFHFDYGNPKNALATPNSVVLMKSVADKLFGKEDPLGKVIQIDNRFGKYDFTINGVIDESLGKSHIRADFFVSMNSGGYGGYFTTENSWAGSNLVMSYIRVRPGTNVTALEKKFPAFLKKYGGAQLKSWGMEKQFYLQPLSTIHTTTGFRGLELSKPISPQFLYILILIAALIQIIACINFMNLSTARASKRAKEVGVRKVIGAVKSNLIKQFLSESFLLALIGVMIALPLLILLLPYLNMITQADIQLYFLKDYRLWLMLAAMITITGLAAGSYPAFYLSAFKAINVIKGNFTNHISATGIRRSLVVFQFVLSIVLITGIIVIYSQLNYVKNKDLGFDKDQKIGFTFYTNETVSQIPSFINDLQKLPEIKSVTRTDNFPGQDALYDLHLFRQGGNIATAPDASSIEADENFIKTTGIKLIAGRDFRHGDSTKIIINEKLAEALGLNPDQAPGTKLFSQSGNGIPMTFEIAGVMKDYHYNSLRDEIKPLFIWYIRSYVPEVLISTESKNYKTLLGKIGTLWNKNFAGIPFEYAFVDEEVQKQYKAEVTLSNIINSFTLMAILVSCMGLFGLAAFSAEQRSKEIGIRKVLGANVAGIVQLLSKDFLKLVIIAIIIAIPIAGWAMSKWLQQFAYRIDVSWWMYALAGIISVIIALVTVSFQAIKAAIANPVKSLRSE
ncbi:MAG TPA: ABC transporter permease [Puia sp.]|nr:ABC transporter permease [Puia sp.]